MQSGLSQKFWINFTGFQLAWWCAILLTSHSLPILVTLLTCHICFHRSPVNEFFVLLFCGLTGFGVDLLLTAAGVFTFGSDLFPPLWLLLLWFCFSATLKQSLGYFHGRWLIASLCGGVSASLTYIAAAKLGAVTITLSFGAGFMLLMLVWMALFPLLLWLSAQCFPGEAKGAY
ncbi:DUF2878 domain-containing protein [uncultured Amphritea sp.]|uniref:DUF2878 domain-containing protein n=1 Tax=uncultured Amphritea sp. TaxID=981605 RepID=UPI0026249F22|nr:DUF2878 domain-containing protein [uncultured Amphritea sp.]